MMPATHMLVGSLVGVTVHSLTGFPLELLILAGVVGGVLPDFDILHGHRRWLHYPVFYGVAVGLLGAGVLATGLPALAVVFVAALSAWTHSVMDVFAGAELRSWDESEWRDKAVYNHVTGSWMSPRRWAWGGSPRDFLISLAAAIILLVSLPPAFHAAVGGILLLALIETLTIRAVSARVPAHHPTWAHFLQSVAFGAPRETGRHKSVETG